MDSEGFSIPPADRSAWPIDAIQTKTESLLEMDDVGSDGGRYSLCIWIKK